MGKERKRKKTKKRMDPQNPQKRRNYATKIFLGWIEEDGSVDDIVHICVKLTK
jgi:hypothetical protein